MNKALKYITGISLIVLIFAVAWIGFKIWVPIILKGLPSLTVLSPLALFGFAIFAGLITFAAPCAIGIAPAYVAYVLEQTKGVENKFWQGTKAGFQAALGPVIVYGIVGFLLLGLSSVIQISTAVGFGKGQNYLFWFSAATKPIVIIILLIFGFLLLTGYSFETSQIYRYIKNKLKLKEGYMAFGVLYGVGSLGCGLLVFVPLLLLVIAGSNIITGLIALLLYMASFGLALMLITILSVYSKTALFDFIQKHSMAIKRFAGIVVLLGTTWLIIFYVRTGGLM
ncbi:MAG: hypothetical protein IH934_00045 [Nanoarchaeota archaeon]|nr:hypothetical protein [Nanoarchaeota archaeon]